MSLHTKTLVRRFGPIAVALAAMPACNLICPYNADQFFETQVRAECHFYFACCTAGEADVLRERGFPDLSQYRDEGTCVQERLEEGGSLNEGARAIVQAEQAGRFQFDYAIAQQCLEGRINAMNNCDADAVIGDAALTDEVPEVCEGAPGLGKVKDLDPCFFEFECEIPGSICASPLLLIEEPDACAVDDDCRNDELCDNERGICVIDPGAIEIHDDKICISPLLEGDDCAQDPDFPLLPSFCEPGTVCFPDGEDLTCEFLGLEGDECFIDGHCERGLYCDLSDDVPGECAELKGEGDECDSSSECDFPLECDFTRDTPSCEAPLPVDVFICNGIQGADDPVYDIVRD
jgi:hypothetical protein